MLRTWEPGVENEAAVQPRRFVRWYAWFHRNVGSTKMTTVEMRRPPLLVAPVGLNDVAVGSRWAAGWRVGGWRGSRSGGCVRSHAGAHEAEHVAGTHRRATSSASSCRHVPSHASER